MAGRADREHGQHPTLAARAAALGVDAITTDRPAALRSEFAALAAAA